MRGGDLDGLRGRITQLGGVGYVPAPSKSHSADTTWPGAGGTSTRAVKVATSPTATSARSPPFTVRWTTGWMP